MDLLTKNVEHIQKHRPQLYQRLVSYFKNKPKEAAKPAPTAGEDVVYQNSLRLSALKHPRILVFNGFGSGYPFLTYLKDKPANVRDILVVEKNTDAFAEALRAHDLTSYLKSPDV